MKTDRAYWEHVAYCIERIEEDSALGREQVSSSRTHQDAILRNLQLLRESSHRLSDEAKSHRPSVPWSAVRGLRNVLVHDYFGVDWATIWEIIKRDLPVLKAAVYSALAEKSE